MPDQPAPRLAVLGATGRTGRLVVADALATGAVVSVLVRDPARLDPTITADARVRVVVGELDDAAATRAALGDADAVVVAAGVRYRKAHPWSGIDGRGDVAPAAVRAALAAGGARQRVVLLSAFGVGDSWPELPAVARLVVTTSALRAAYAALGDAERLLAEDGRPHVVVRAVTLRDAPGTGRSADATGRRLGGNPRVARADVARLLVDVALAPDAGRRVLVAA